MNRVELQGGCYVTGGAQLEAEAHRHWKLAPVTGPEYGARFLSQHLLDVKNGETPAWSAGDSSAVFYVLRGSGEIRIGGRSFGLSAHTAAHVRPGEAFSLSSGAGLRVLVSVCPHVSLTGLDRMPGRFHEHWPERTVPAGEVRREAAGDRHFRLLLGPHTGCDRVSLFVGHIPPSRAPEHYHLYEEVLCVLSGQGRMWTGAAGAPVGPGSLVFLPREQPHCLECTDPAGMDVLGVFSPAGSPAVAYDTGQA